MLIPLECCCDQSARTPRRGQVAALKTWQQKRIDPAQIGVIIGISVKRVSGRGMFESPRLLQCEGRGLNHYQPPRLRKGEVSPFPPRSSRPLRGKDVEDRIAARRLYPSSRPMTQLANAKEHKVDDNAQPALRRFFRSPYRQSTAIFDPADRAH